MGVCRLLVLVALFDGLVFLMETRGYQLLYTNAYGLLSAVCGIGNSVLFRKTVPCFKHHQLTLNATNFTRVTLI